MATGRGRRRPISRFWRGVVVSVLVAILVILVLEFAPLNPVHFSGQIRTLGGLPGPTGGPPFVGPFTQTLPRGPSITVHWAVVGVGEVVFEVIPPGPGPVSTYSCFQRGLSDSCSFISVGGNYTFQAFNVVSPPVSEVVNVTGGYLTPLL